MNFLFVHQNFPGQFRHLVQQLAADPAHKVVAIGDKANLRARSTQNLDIHGYDFQAKGNPATHHYVRPLELHVRRGQTVLRTAQELKKRGFVPDTIVAHPAWGDSLFLKDIFPEARYIAYFEYFYHGTGKDVGFDPEWPASLDDVARVRVKNATQLLSLVACDLGLSPTQWQKSLFPPEFQQKISVVHEGIDTDAVKPDNNASIEVSGRRFQYGEEIVTYVARNLEPYRGFHTFMRALPAIQAQRPDAHVIVVGGNKISYGQKLPEGQSYRQIYTDELGDRVDWSRVHFTGTLPYDQYLKVLQVSAAHLYLTYPFVLSWSMLEAMATGCLLIASATPPVQEVVEHRKSGLLVDFFDAEQLAASVAEALAHPEKHQGLRVAARQTIVDRYDLRTICLPQMMDLVTKT